MLATLFKCPSNIWDSLFMSSLWCVLFPTNTLASSSLPFINSRFSSTFFTCWSSDFLDQWGISDQIICVFLAGILASVPIPVALSCSSLLWSWTSVVHFAWFPILALCWSSVSDVVCWAAIFLNVFLLWFSCWTTFDRCKVCGDTHMHGDTRSTPRLWCGGSCFNHRKNYGHPQLSIKSKGKGKGKNLKSKPKIRAKNPAEAARQKEQDKTTDLT